MQNNLIYWMNSRSIEKTHAQEEGKYEKCCFQEVDNDCVRFPAGIAYGHACRVRGQISDGRYSRQA
jgi:hypothetical protein